MVSFCSNKLKDEQLSIQGSGCLGGQDWCVQKDMLQIMLQDSFYHPKNRGVLWFIPEKKHGRYNTMMTKQIQGFNQYAAF